MNLFLNEVNVKSPSESNKTVHPFNLDLFSSGLNIKFNKPVTFILGDNGSGKSTLLENIAYKIGFNPLGGNKNHYYNDEKIRDNFNLADDMSLAWNEKTNEGFFFRAESYFSFITYLDEMQKLDPEFLQPYGGKSLQKQSHGESFLSLFQNKFHRGIFILDEPEAALSPEKQFGLISIITELAKTGKAQFIISSHSPILIACPDADIYEIENGALEKIDFTQSKQFKLYKGFLDNPQRYLSYLCD